MLLSQKWLATSFFYKILITKYISQANMHSFYIVCALSYQRVFAVL